MTESIIFDLANSEFAMFCEISIGCSFSEAANARKAVDNFCAAKRGSGDATISETIATPSSEWFVDDTEPWSVRRRLVDLIPPTHMGGCYLSFNVNRYRIIPMATAFICVPSSACSNVPTPLTPMIGLVNAFVFVPQTEPMPT